MQLKIDTPAYNPRREGCPWIATVDFTTSKGEFRFGEWVGQTGDCGLLLLDCQPGDIIARGQKDFRKPRNSAPSFFEAMADGTLRPLDSKAEAYKLYQSHQQPQSNSITDDTSDILTLDIIALFQAWQDSVAASRNITVSEIDTAVTNYLTSNH